MARTFTVGELLTELRKLCDWENLDGDYSEAGSYMSSGTLTTFLDRAHEYAWNEYAEADEGFNLTRHTLSTVPGSGSYDLPPDVLSLKSVEVAADSAASGWVPLSRATVDDDRYVGTGNGVPHAYRIVGETLELIRTPGEVRSVRLTYTPVAPHLSSSLQTVDGSNGFAQVTVLKAAIRGRIREEKPYGDLQAELADHLDQMRRMVRRRDRGTPAHTRDRREGRWPRRSRP